jgi:SNF2 family DNA or RNA helicase
MIFTPKEHQTLGIDHLGRNELAILLAGMGLGKTAMVLERLNRDIPDGGCKGALVIAPLRVSLFTWRDEVAKWESFRWMRVVSLRTPEGLAAWERGDACIYTINYESLYIPRTNPKTGEITDHGLVAKLLKGKRASQLPVDTVIWDELSKAKNPSSKRIQHFRKYRNKFRRHWGLTGTPTPNSYVDLFAQVRLIDEGATFGKVMGNFKTQFLEPVDFHERKWRVRDDAKGVIELKLSRIALTLRSEDWLEIPPVITEDVEVAFPAKAAAIYKKLLKEMIVTLEDSKVKAVNKGVLIGKLQQFTGGAVYAESIEAIMRGSSDTKTVTVIHDAKLKALRKLFDAHGRQPVIVAIKYKHERERILAAFPEAEAFHSDKLDRWNQGKIKMLVAHPLSMSHGLNMQSGGNRIIWFSMTHSLEEYEQLNARLARTGQKKETFIHRLVINGTVDDAVVAALEAKAESQDGFMELTSRNLVTLAKLVG